MGEKSTKRTERILLCSMILIYFFINLLFLDRFPFVHSDESWLAGLTRNMLQNRSLSVTETFFNLVPRSPHAIKSLFHLMQMPFLLLFGYSAFSVRLLSLLFGCGALVLTYKTVRLLTPRIGVSFLLTLILACDVQFVAALHFARQEMVLVMGMLACMYILLKREGSINRKDILLLACITGICIGIHPNSFLIAVMCGCMLLLRMLLFRDLSVRLSLLYVGITGAFAGLFVAASLYMNPHFFADYFAYGASEFGIDAPLLSKANELGYYFTKLFGSVSGTYYVPDIRPQLVLFPALIVFALMHAIRIKQRDIESSRKLLSILAAIFGILAGTVLIGRYNQTGIVFLFPFCWLLLPFAADALGKRLRGIVFALVAFVILATSIANVLPWLSHDYDDYTSQIARSVPPEAKVIANLNTGFYFDNGALLDYRNLPNIKTTGKHFADYVRENGVEYLIISQELYDIHNQRPKWNIIYGNVHNYLEEMQKFLISDCEEVDSFVNNTYGVRIIELMQSGREFTVRVYRVKP